MKKLILCILINFTLLCFAFCDDVANANEPEYTQSTSQISYESTKTTDSVNYDLIYQLITNGVSIFIAGCLPSHLNKKNDILKSKITKLETFYVDVSEWYNSSFLGLSAFNMVFNGQMTTNQYDEWFIKKILKKNQLASEISLYLYFPDIRKEYKDMINSVQEAYTYTWSLKSKTQYSKQERQKYEELVLSTNEKFEILKSKIIKKTRYCK